MRNRKSFKQGMRTEGEERNPSPESPLAPNLNFLTIDRMPTFIHKDGGIVLPLRRSIQYNPTPLDEPF
jgi:hypothetical protein